MEFLLLASFSEIMGYVGYIALAVLILLVMITVHELGHYIAGKIFGFGIDEFSVGFGPKLFSKKKKSGELFSVRLLPIGGFVQMEGEAEDSTHERAFTNVSIPKRIAIVAAGAIVNIIFGILVYFLLISIVGLQFVDPAKDTILNRIYYGGIHTGEFILSIFDSVKMLFTNGILFAFISYI